MRQLASLTSETVRHMVSIPLGEDGLPAGLSGRLDGLNASDTGAVGCNAAAFVLRSSCAAAGNSCSCRCFTV